jgi:hypothetical protein
MLFKRCHPEKKDAEQQVNWGLKVKEPSEEEQRVLEETLQLQKDLYKKQDILRESKSIARGNKSSKGYFVNITKEEWEEKKIMINRLIEEEQDLEKELASFDNPDANETSEEEHVDWMNPVAPLPPQAVPVGDEEISFQSSFGTFSADYE